MIRSAFSCHVGPALALAVVLALGGISTGAIGSPDASTKAANDLPGFTILSNSEPTPLLAQLDGQSQTVLPTPARPQPWFTFPPLAAATAATPEAAPSVLESCRARVADLAAQNAILFQSGSAVIAATSHAALDELAADLRICPQALVYVEGHTDADGDADQNLALSVARAEAVIEALVARAIAPQRLYAVGYGESQPIAPNDTKAGKQLNRRIVFTIVEDEL